MATTSARWQCLAGQPLPRTSGSAAQGIQACPEQRCELRCLPPLPRLTQPVLAAARAVLALLLFLGPQPLPGGDRHIQAALDGAPRVPGAQRVRGAVLLQARLLRRERRDPAGLPGQVPRLCRGEWTRGGGGGRGRRGRGGAAGLPRLCRGEGTPGRFAPAVWGVAAGRAVADGPRSRRSEPAPASHKQRAWLRQR